MPPLGGKEWREGGREEGGREGGWGALFESFLNASFGYLGLWEWLMIMHEKGDGVARG